MSARERRLSTEAPPEVMTATNTMLSRPDDSAPEPRAEIILDGIDGEQLRATAWTDDEDGFFRIEVYLDAGDDEPIAEIDLPPEAALHLALAMGGTATRFLDGAR